MISLLGRALIGAAVVLLISLLARTKSYFVAGLVPLFPTFALIAHVIVGTERGPSELRTTAVFGLWSLIPYAAYLITVYFLTGRYRLGVTLVSATVVWFAAASVLIVVWSRARL